MQDIRIGSTRIKCRKDGCKDGKMTPRRGGGETGPYHIWECDKCKSISTIPDADIRKEDTLPPG